MLRERLMLFIKTTALMFVLNVTGVVLLILLGFDPVENSTIYRVVGISGVLFTYFMYMFPELMSLEKRNREKLDKQILDALNRHKGDTNDKDDGSDQSNH